MRTLWLVVAWGLLWPGAVRAQEPTPERGRAVFESSRCAICHAIAGKGNTRGSLDKVGARLTPEDIREWIVNAPAMTAKTNAQRKPAMRAFTQLSQEDVSALVAYLSTLKD